MFDLMKEPEPTYGFKFCYGTEGRCFLDAMDNKELEPGCIIRKVTNALFNEINKDRLLGVPHIKNLPFVDVGQYIIFSGSCQSGINSYGPFDSLIAAQDFSGESLGFNYFYQYSDPDSCINTDETFPVSV